MKVEERLRQFLEREPQVDPTAYIAAGATVIGDVRLGPRSSVWHSAVLRGDINYIELGEGSNVQDGAVVHLADDFPAIIGRYVTIGHGAIVHACVVEDECLIGMGATVLDGAVIGRNSIVGAHALVTQGTRIPPGSLVLGSPAKVVKTLSAEEQAKLRGWAEKYVAVSSFHRQRYGSQGPWPLPLAQS
jgi:gamma-carbonic anhydrase